MECQKCGHAPLVHLVGDLLNVYDLRCNICNHYYCGVCGLIPSHFPALCEERVAWQHYFTHRDANFPAIYNPMLANNIARTNIYTWRNQIGPAAFDAHPHIRFAVDELTRVSSISSWARVVSHFSDHHAGLIQSNRFQQMMQTHQILLDQCTAAMAAQPPVFQQLGLARLGLCRALYRFLSLLRSTRNPIDIVYPAHANLELINYFMNFDNALMMWALNPTRQ